MVGKPASERADQAPVGMHALTVHRDHRRARLRNGRVNGQKPVAGLLREIDGVADNERGRDLIGPALFARVVGLRECKITI